MGKDKPKIYYKLKIQACYPSFSFGVMEDFLQNYLGGKVSESSSLYLDCKIESPQIKNIDSCTVVVYSSFDFEKYLRDENLKDGIEKIGLMEKKRGDSHLWIFISLPTSLFESVNRWAVFDKVTDISIYADKLRYGKGDVYNISFSNEGPP